MTRDIYASPPTQTAPPGRENGQEDGTLPRDCHLLSTGVLYRTRGHHGVTQTLTAQGLHPVTFWTSLPTPEGEEQHLTLIWGASE